MARKTVSAAVSGSSPSATAASTKRPTASRIGSGARSIPSACNRTRVASAMAVLIHAGQNTEVPMRSAWPASFSSALRVSVSVTTPCFATV